MRVSRIAMRLRSVSRVAACRRVLHVPCDLGATPAVRAAAEPRQQALRVAAELDRATTSGFDTTMTKAIWPRSGIASPGSPHGASNTSSLAW